ncbi:hypothetical protein [Sulfurimonas sp. HSL3-7]|uniref:hypothetical protein n=1 Tax=Sulfonitrofixus jiaomeiensis TaxID=3131938 RepID=UPI0031F9587E
MDANTMYYGGLVLIAILAYLAYTSNRIITALLLLALGGYFIYAHNTGNTITDFTNKTVEKINKQL